MLAPLSCSSLNQRKVTNDNCTQHMTAMPSHRRSFCSRNVIYEDDIIAICTCTGCIRTLFIWKIYASSSHHHHHHHHLEAVPQLRIKQKKPANPTTTLDPTSRRQRKVAPASSRFVENGLAK